jgi:hypothetical protein
VATGSAVGGGAATPVRAEPIPPPLHKFHGIIAAKLVVSAARTGVIGMVTFVPVVGGLVNGALDGLATRGIGRQADILFGTAAKWMMPT